MRRLMKIKFPVTLWTVRLVSRSYVRSEVFRENLIFSPLFAYSPTPRAIKDTLRPPNSEYNLHPM